MNNENLIPNSQRSPSEVRENGRKGGIASGKARREKRTIQKILNELLDGDVKDKPQFVEIASKLGIDTNQSVKDMFTLVCLINSLKEGNLYNLEQLSKLIGEDKQNKNEDVINKLDKVLGDIDEVMKDE